jgi:hypothetical protein
MSFKLKEETYDNNINENTEIENIKNKKIHVLSEQNHQKKNTNKLFYLNQINCETNQNKSDNSGNVNILMNKNELFKGIRNKTDFFSNNNLSVNVENDTKRNNTKHSVTPSVNLYIEELKKHSVINFLNRNCSINYIFFTLVINSIFSFSIVILNIDDIKQKEKYYIRNIYIFLLELFNSLYIEISFFIFRLISSLWKYKIILIINIIIIIFALNLIFNYLFKNESKIYRIINLIFSLFMITSNLITINKMCKFNKKKQNNLQNIEDIISFSEVNKNNENKKEFNNIIYDKIKEIAGKKNGMELIEEEHQNDIKNNKNIQKNNDNDNDNNNNN